MTTGPIARGGRAATLRDPRQAAIAALLLALALSAWAALAWWSAGPYARYVLHDGWASGAFVAGLCRAIPAGGIVVPALMHAAAWVLMIAAMMLPTTLPLLSMVVRVAGGRGDAGTLVALVVAGYAGAWLAFGLVAHLADEGVRAIAAGSPWLAAHGWAVGAVVLAGAGAFQFSDWKYRCLDRCRTPFGFVASRWRGLAPRREALRLGVDHGLFCVGCCFALMLVMFVVGTASLAWMLGLALAMAAEKNLPFGPRLRAPIGLALFAGAAALALPPLAAA